MAVVKKDTRYKGMSEEIGLDIEIERHIQNVAFTV